MGMVCPPDHVYDISTSHRTPIHYAAATAQYQSVLSLVANGASLTITDNLNRTALHYAAAADNDAK